MSYWALLIGWITSQFISVLLGVTIFWPVALGVGAVLAYLAISKTLDKAIVKPVEAMQPFSIEPTAEDRALALEMYESGIRESYVASSGAIVDVAGIGEAANLKRLKIEREAKKKDVTNFNEVIHEYAARLRMEDLTKLQGFKKSGREPFKKRMVPGGIEINQETGAAKLNYSVYEVRQLGNIYVGTVNGIVKFQTFDRWDAQEWLNARCSYDRIQCADCGENEIHVNCQGFGDEWPIHL